MKRKKIIIIIIITESLAKNRILTSVLTMMLICYKGERSNFTENMSDYHIHYVKVYLIRNWTNKKLSII